MINIEISSSEQFFYFFFFLATPPTIDGRVHLKQEENAVYENSTDEFHAVLACGKFVLPHQPNFDVIWTVKNIAFR